MPVPKRRQSRARRNKRRAHHYLRPAAASICENCSAVILPHTVCPECGHYKGREVIEVGEE